MRTQIRYNEEILDEDVPFTVQAILACSRLCYFRREMYVYCHRLGSSTQSRISVEKVYSVFKTAMDFFKIWIENGSNEEQREIMSYLYKSLLAYCRNIYIRLPLEKRYQIKNRVKDVPLENELFDLLVDENLPGNYVQTIDIEKLNQIKEYSRVIIYGAGNYAVDIYMLLKKQFVNICGFAVTEYNQNESIIDGKPVLLAEEWLREREKSLIIIGCKDSDKKEIYSHLEELGFANVMSL